MDPTLFLVLSFAGGAVVGAVLANWLVRRGGRAAQDRLAQLEIEFAKVRSELESRNAEIATHFGRTSDLFRDLTERYTDLYAHLADGARQFCAGDVPAIARGLDGLLSAGGAERGAAEGAGDEPPAGERNGSASRE